MNGVELDKWSCKKSCELCGREPQKIDAECIVKGNDGKTKVLTTQIANLVICSVCLFGRIVVPSLSPAYSHRIIDIENNLGTVGEEE
jgi:hypothetical protein|tara:strand:+ start:11362 stop:11622 length:261 start_codon:yes stop_codon:yes gene_type:complete